MMFRKDYKVISDSVKELQKSGITSGTISKRVIDKFLGIIIPKL